MKKPLVLIVDDDSAVLDALEAALLPAFEEIARVEAFQDPADVLAAIPRWIEERRPIAVAIVDQKMPGMTGVELLTCLREQVAAAADGFHPATHMQSIILTGYAGLDSALTAKNDAGVRRYLEKPWSVDALASEVSTGFWRHLDDSGWIRHAVFRAVRSIEETRRHFELRFQVYREASNTDHFLNAGTSLDIDADDRDSWLFGLFVKDPGERERMAGTLRVTGVRPGPHVQDIQEIVGRIPELTQRFDEKPTEPLPMVKYLIDRSAVIERCAEIAANGERVVEPGRLALISNARRGGLGDRSLARHMLDGAVSHWIGELIDAAMLTCSPPHDQFYYRYGFERLNGTERRFHAEFGRDIDCLHIERTKVSPEINERLRPFVGRIARRGESCLCPSFPECTHLGYESGRFEAVDTFCPIRATELLDPELPRDI